MLNRLDSLAAAWLAPLRALLGPLSINRQTSLGGAYIPTLMLVFLLCAALTWVIDMAIARIGVYAFVLHPPLFRASLFVCLLAVIGLSFYG